MNGGKVLGIILKGISLVLTGYIAFISAVVLGLVFIWEPFVQGTFIATREPDNMDEIVSGTVIMVLALIFSGYFFTACLKLSSASFSSRPVSREPLKKRPITDRA